MATNGREQAPLGERVKQYYREAQMSDGCGGRLQLRGVNELAPGVVSVLDSLGEVDIIYDLHSWGVAENTRSPYDLFLAGVRENAQKNVHDRFGLTAIAESAWHPFYGRDRASHDSSLEAAKAYLKPKNDEESPKWNDSPIPV